MPNRVGEQLGNYRLLRLLGRGGFAEVYLGEHVYLKRHAALKVLHTSLEDEDRDKFLAEAQTLARLTHANIVHVSDFAVQQGIPFLVMDYAPLGTLRQRHPRGSCLSLETIVAYVKQVAAALQYAHNHQVIHRDVKPENMLLGSHEQVMLSDFGISMFSPSSEQVSRQGHEGTLPYMAPEQIRGKPGFASDQYALGIVAYEWLCGSRPFEGTHWQVAYQHVTALPPPLCQKDPSLPEAVEEVIQKALAKDPQERYVSVQLFAQALEKACQTNYRNLRSDAEVTTPLGAPSSSLMPPKRVFLSASQDDEDFVAGLTTDLQQRGITVWQKPAGSTHHTRELENLVRQAIRAAEVVLLVVSPDARTSRSVNEHLRIAGLYQRRLVFVWAVGEEIVDVLPEQYGKTLQIDLIDAREEHYEQALDEVVACLQGEVPVEETIVPEPAFEPRNPYKGLRAFKQDDTADFFGRETLVQELLEKVKESVQTYPPERIPQGSPLQISTPLQEPLGSSTARLLAVIGPSGSGKSSVVMAGLLPQLQRGELAGSEQWVYLESMVPGSQPLEALALTFAPRFPDRSVKSICEDLEDKSARGLHLLATQLVKAPEQKVVLLIDQFEELFTLTTSEEERQHFIDLLFAAITEPQGSVMVLLTLRADFYDRPMAYPVLHRQIEAHQKSVLPMEIGDLRAVIKRPATLLDVQLSFEGSLIGDLLFKVQGQPGALPLLQFMLEQLFERRSGHQLTLSAYHELGEVKGALAKHAESTYAVLPSEEHRKLARALFLRLIDPGITEQDTTRRRAALSELSLPDPAQTNLLRETTDAFITARLLTTSEHAGTTTVEVSHEALIREWPRLAGWLREAREDIRLQQNLSSDVAEWGQRGKPKDRLYRGSQLKEARTWAIRNIPSRDEVAFLRASTTRRTHYLVSIIAIVLLLLSTVGLASRLLLAPTLVTNLQDDNRVGSLRWVIDNAPSGSTITFLPGLTGIITLTGDLPIAKKNLTIRGLGADLLTINGNTRQIDVRSGATVQISDLTFTGSKSNTNPLLSNEGTLTLTNSVVSGNANNSDAGFGGGIYNNKGSMLTLTNSTISGNTAARGGGFYNAGTFTVISSTISGNTAVRGGGFYNFVDGKLTVINSTVSHNVATTKGVLRINDGDGNGGGIDSVDTFTMIDSTISDNTATYRGGGIYNFGAQADITFCTIYGNKAGDNGGGLSIRDYIAVNSKDSSFSQVSIRNSFVAGNLAPIGPDISGKLTSGGYNLIQNTSSVTFVPNQQHATDISGDPFPNLNIDPLLRDNGGLAIPHTFTHALLTGSPAIDKIPLADCQVKLKGTAIIADQRGVKRPDEHGQSCDIGAYESSP